MKLVGAVLLIGACVLFGVGWTGSMRRKIESLDRFCQGLRYLETDLLQKGTPLADLLERQGTMELAERLREGCLFSQAIEPLIKKLESRFGRGEVVSTVEELAVSLGRYDAQTQAAACQRARDRLEACREKIEIELSEKQRLYRTVPVAMGLMVVLAVI